MEWKTIINYPEHEISDTGLIRRTKAFRKYPKGYVLKPSVHEGGHLFVTLGRRKKTRCVAVHILVAEHFIGPRPKNHIVHHKDLNKANNHVSNLEYVPINEHAKKHSHERFKIEKAPQRERVTHLIIDDKIVCGTKHVRPIFTKNINMATCKKCIYFYTGKPPENSFGVLNKANDR